MDSTPAIAKSAARVRTSWPPLCGTMRCAPATLIKCRMPPKAGALRANRAKAMPNGHRLLPCQVIRAARLTISADSISVCLSIQKSGDAPWPC